MKKVILIIFLSLWTLFFAIGIISNMSHYKVADWIVIILIAIIPYVIYFIVKFNCKKRQVNSASSKSTNVDDIYKAATETLAKIRKQSDGSVPKPIGKVTADVDLYAIAEEERKQLEDLGAEKYQILGNLDYQTCSKCGKMDGKVFDVKDYKPGVTAPPFCDHCRCTIVPYLDNELWGDEEGERVARDKNGNTYYVPGNVTYSKWKKTLQK